MKEITDEERRRWSSNYGYGIFPLDLAQRLEARLDTKIEIKLEKAEEIARGAVNRIAELVEDELDEILDDYEEKLKNGSM